MIGVGSGGKGGGGGSIGSVPFPNVTGNPLGNTALAPYLNSVTNLENNESKYLYWQSVSTNSGTVTIPAGATVLLGEIEGLNALVETISSGKPTGNSPKTILGASVIVSSFDTSGNYVLSSTPSSFPVAIIFVFKIKAKDISNVDLNFVLADETVQTETTFGNFIKNLTVDSTPQDTDTTVISDPTDSNRAKKLSLLTLWLYIKAKADDIYLVIMTGATAALSGNRGLVPQPLSGQQNHVLAGSGAWRTIANILGFTPLAAPTWATYTPSAAATGFSSFSWQVYTTCLVGKVRYVCVRIEGVSNAGFLTFRLPSIPTDAYSIPVIVLDNNAKQFGAIEFGSIGTDIVTVRLGAGGGFQAFGGKYVRGCFSYIEP